jgi:polyhydroxyalkanoate synthase subunit PhaC
VKSRGAGAPQRGTVPWAQSLVAAQQRAVEIDRERADVHEPTIVVSPYTPLVPDDRPAWKVVYDAFERVVEPQLERAVRSREFEHAAVAGARARSFLRSRGVPSALLSPDELVERVQRDLERSLLATRNRIKPLPSIDNPMVAQTPRDVVWQRDKAVLYRYRSDRRAYRPPLLLTMSLVSKAYIFDLRPGSSLVEAMLDHGLDVYMLDWGIPDADDAGNSFETYCDEYLPQAVAATCAASESDDLTLLGYCLGGVLTNLYVAANADGPVRNLVVVATPCDFSKLGPMGTMVAHGRLDADDLVDDTGNVPAQAILNAFRLLKPMGDLSSYADLWVNLWSDEYLESYQAIMGWARDQIPFPGEAMRQMVRMFNRENAFVTDTARLGGRRVSLRDIRCPFLSVMSMADHITPPDAVTPMLDLVGSEDKSDMRFETGHVGLIVGRNAARNTMPGIAEWITQRSGSRVV